MRFGIPLSAAVFACTAAESFSRVPFLFYSYRRGGIASFHLFTLNAVYG